MSTTPFTPISTPVSEAAAPVHVFASAPSAVPSKLTDAIVHKAYEMGKAAGQREASATESRGCCARTGSALSAAFRTAVFLAKVAACVAFVLYVNPRIGKAALGERFPMPEDKVDPLGDVLVKLILPARHAVEAVCNEVAPHVLAAWAATDVLRAAAMRDYVLPAAELAKPLVHLAADYATNIFAVLISVLASIKLFGCPQAP